MPIKPHQPRALLRRAFRASDALRGGLLTRAQLRSSAWQRVIRGVYADARLPLDHELKARAAALVIPSSAAITGVSAAWFWGARLASPNDPVDIVAMPGRRVGVADEIRVRTSPVPPADTDMLSGIRLTTPVRTAWELALRLPLAEAVAYGDALARLGRIDLASLDSYLRHRAGQRGCRIAKTVFALIDGRAESPQESRLRVQLAVTGLPSPVPQHEVHVNDRFVARVDLAWPQVKVGVEYDGLWHGNSDQLIRDRRRLNDLQAAGWHIHHVTVSDMRDILTTVDAIRQLLARRGLLN